MTKAVKKIIDLHEGRIDLANRAEGGVAAKITLKASNAAGQSLPSVKTSPKP